MVARAFWAPDDQSLRQSYSPVEQALIARKKAVKMARTEGRRPDHDLIPIGAACQYIEHLIHTVQTSYLPMRVYNGMVATLPLWVKDRSDPFEIEFKRSRLQLKHPEQPSADAALKILRRQSDGRLPESASRIIGGHGGNSSAMLFYYCLRVAKRLHEQGREQDARWVLTFGRSQIPESFEANHNIPYNGIPEPF